MTLISCCPLPYHIFKFRWALFIRILAGVRTFYYKAKTTSVYQRLQMLKSLYEVFLTYCA